MPRFVLALDQGTTSSRAILFNREGIPVAQAQRELPPSFPLPGWVEHDPEEIWVTQVSVAEEALLRAGASAGDIAAVGITNQRETTLLWDRADGKPVGNAIVWQDRRTAEQCERLRAGGFEQVIRDRTGLVLDPYFSATKLAWMLEHIPGVRERAADGALAFGTVDSFLVWRLTGGRHHATDPSNASRTMLYDLNEHRWSPELLELFGIPESVLPKVVSSCGRFAETDASIFGAPVSIAGLIGDQQAATFGQACFEPGMLKNTYGTGCFLLANAGNQVGRPSKGLLNTTAWKVGESDPVYAVEGSVFIAGAAIQWLRDGLGILASSAESEGLARSVPDTAGVSFVPAFVGLGAPHWDPKAQGLISGLTRGTGRAHVVRAALESIAFQSEDVLRAMRSSGLGVSELRVDGGASRNDFLMQFQADVSGVPVVRPKSAETTAFGAAMLAGLAVGFWSGIEELRSLHRVDRRFEPEMTEGERAAHQDRWQSAVMRALTRSEDRSLPAAHRSAS